MSAKQSSLVVVGTGIKAISHLSVEAIAYIQKADIVLYSVNEPIIQSWIHDNNVNSQSLDSLVSSDGLRRDVYAKISDHILDKVRSGLHVCVVFYGHPTMYATSALDAAKQAKSEGFYTLVLPAISAENCLYADLLIDPGSSGCQSYEATDFLIRKKYVDTSSHLILWQVGIIGNLSNSLHDVSVHRLAILRDRLIDIYHHKHTAIAYEASIYPHLQPKINKFTLDDMLEQWFSPLTMLYLPPMQINKIEHAMLNLLEIDANELR